MGGLSVAAARRGELPIAASCLPLVGYLVTQRQRHVSRGELAETIWAERDRSGARHCLATALWRLKHACGDAPALLRVASNGELGFNWAAAHWVDALAFEHRIAPLLRCKPQAMGARELVRMEHALQLYRGEYISGCDAEWALFERQRLRSLYCDGLYQLVNACAAQAEWQRAVDWGRRLGREEPLREDVQRLVMLGLAHTGNRALALAMYRDCAARLQAELGVEPMAETQDLARSLAASGAVLPAAPTGGAAGPALPPAAMVVAKPAPMPAPMPTAAPGIEHARRRIGRVQRALAASQRQLDEALGALDPGKLPAA